MLIVLRVLLGRWSSLRSAAASNWILITTSFKRESIPLSQRVRRVKHLVSSNIVEAVVSKALDWFIFGVEFGRSDQSDRMFADSVQHQLRVRGDIAVVAVNSCTKSSGCQ